MSVLSGLPTLELTYETLGYYGTPNTVKLWNNPTHPLDEGTMWTLKLFPGAETKTAIIHRIRATSFMWIEYIVNICDDVHPLLLLVPIKYASRTPALSSQSTISFYNYLRCRPWLFEESWTNILKYSRDGSDLELISAFVRKHPFPNTSSIVIKSLAQCISGSTTSPTYLLHATDTLLAVGHFITLHFWSAHQVSRRAKIVGIRVMEQGWFELCMQVYPADVPQLGRHLLRLVVPHTYMQLDIIISQLYASYYFLLPSVLNDARLPSPTSLNIVLNS